MTDKETGALLGIESATPAVTVESGGLLGIEGAQPLGTFETAAVFGIEGTLPEGAPPQPPPVPIPMIDFSGKPVPAPRRGGDPRVVSAKTGQPVSKGVVPAPKRGGGGGFVPARRRRSITLTGGPPSSPTIVEIEAATGNVLTITIDETKYVDYGATQKLDRQAANRPVLLVGPSRKAVPAPFSVTLFTGVHDYEDPSKPPTLIGPVTPQEIICDAPTYDPPSGWDNSVQISWPVTSFDRLLPTSFPPPGIVGENGAARLGREDRGRSARPQRMQPTRKSYGNGRDVIATVSALIRIQPDGTVEFGEIAVTRPQGDDPYVDFGLSSITYPIIAGIVRPAQGPTQDGEVTLAWPDIEGKTLADPHRFVLRDLTDVGLSGIYPNGYSMTMQFMGIYGDAPGFNRGLYFGTHDDSMSLKVLNLLAVASAGASPASFTFGLCHGNGDIATGYVANANRSGGTDYLPVWKDYVQPSYYLTVRQVRPTGPIGWYDFADVYKSWARQQLWAQVPRLGRDTFGFYKNTGLVVGFPGSVFAVSHPDPGPYDPREDFILAFHNILRRDADHPSRVLFVTGWDWHPPFVTVQRPGGAQWGDRQEYWLARYGVSGSGYRSNYDRIKGLGDFVLPYLFEFRMDIDFDGWTQPDPGVAGGRGAAKADPNAPWFDKVIVPQEGGVQLRPRGLCPATPAFAQYFADREDYIRHAVIDGDPSTILTLDGAYHDVGAGIGGFACYGCGIGAGHSHNIGYQIGFKIGMGGFLFGAVREILTANLYGPGVTRPIFGQKRRELYGTEAIHELLIDVVDLYGTVPSWGPYKDALTDEHGAYTPPPPPSPTSPNQAMWLTYWMLKERICVEEPMLQYVYGPVMAVKAHNATVSGAVPYGTHPTNDIGDAFYWLAAQAYLNGMVLNLQYDNTPLDVLANPANPNDPNSMDPKTPTYMLGWLRETLQQALRPESVGPEVGEDPDPLAPEGTLMPLAGKHPIAGGDSRFLRFRTYGDPKKLQYVRMLAYVRSHVLSEFLVHGEMMRPGTAATAQEPVALAYNYYWSMSHHAGNHSGEWRPASDLVSRAWREAVGEFPRVLYLVANVGREARGCSFAADLDLYGSHAARGHELQLSPGDEGSWRDWRAIAEPLAPVNGRIRVRRQVLLAPGQVWVLRLSIQTGDGEGR